MKPTDTMNDSQKQILEDKLNKRREHYKNKYAENPEYYKQKAAEYRMRKKQEQMQSAQQTA